MYIISQRTPEQALTDLHTSLQGLSEREAKNRLAEYGPNVLKKVGGVPLWQKFLGQFVDPMIIMMFGAAFLAWLLGSVQDVVVLLSIVFINAVIGFIQEYKAENLLASLQSLLTPKAKVMRDGIQIEIVATEVVPGDIINLTEGDAVPADIRLLSINNIATNDFSLTGESNPKTKFVHALSTEKPLHERDNQVYQGTTVARGNATGVVFATGMNTEIGKIAAITEKVGNEQSPLQKEIGNITIRLIFIAIILAGIITILNLTQHSPLQTSLLAGLGIAAAIVPQGLPAQLSVIFSLGAGRLATKKAILKRLYSVETLGSTNIICSDKTGTITTNEMTIEAIWQNDKEYLVRGIGYTPEGTIADQAEIRPELFLSGILASTGNIAPPDDEHACWYALGSPNEAALITLAHKAKLDVAKLRKEWQEVKQYPFDAVRKLMSSIRKVPGSTKDGKHVIFVKGALDSILAATNLSAAEKSHIEEVSKKYTKKSLHLLAFGYRDISEKEIANLTMATSESGLTFLGFVAMLDPPRIGVNEAIALARKAHVRTFIVTGDQADTARAIAENIGLSTDHELEVINGEELASLSDEQMKLRLQAPAIIFARTSPEDKLRIVQVLREAGNVVAVTGDGVNDAPALKQADIGVAMGRIGTEVAKQAAEIILTDDSYVTLVAAIKEGRTIYTNLKKTLYSTLSSNGGELVAVLAGSLLYYFGYPDAIYAIHILMVDLLGEMLPLLALTFDPAPDDLMTQKPRALKEHFLTGKALIDILYVALFMGGIAVLVFVYFLRSHGYYAGVDLNLDNPFYLRALTLTYATLMMGQFANILCRRHETQSLFSSYFWSNPKLLASIVISLGLMSIAIYTPFLQPYLRTANLTLGDWLYATIGFVAMVAAHEARKWWRRRKLANA